MKALTIGMGDNQKGVERIILVLDDLVSVFREIRDKQIER